MSVQGCRRAKHKTFSPLDDQEDLDVETKYMVKELVTEVGPFLSLPFF